MHPKKDLTHYNANSMLKRIRRKLFIKFFSLTADVDDVEQNGKVPDTGHVFTTLESLEQLMAIKDSIVNQVSQAKFESIYQRFTDQTRKSMFCLVYKDDQLCGYVELVWEDFFDSALQYTVSVPHGALFVVDHIVFPSFRRMHIGSQILRLAAMQAKLLNFDTLVSLIEESNIPSIGMFVQMSFVQYGTLYCFLNKKYIQATLPGFRPAKRTRIPHKKLDQL